MSVFPHYIQQIIIENWYSHSKWLLKHQKHVNWDELNWINGRRLDMSLVSKHWFKKISTLISSDIRLSHNRRKTICMPLKDIISMTSSPYQLQKSIGFIRASISFDDDNISYKDIYGFDVKETDGKEEELARLFSTLKYLNIGSLESIDVVEPYFGQLPLLKQKALNKALVDSNRNDGNDSFGDITMYQPLKELCIDHNRDKNVEVFDKLFNTLTPFIVEGVEKLDMYLSSKSCETPLFKELCNKFANGFKSLKHFTIRTDRDQHHFMPALLDSLPTTLESITFTDVYWQSSSYFLPFTKLLRLSNLKTIFVSSKVQDQGELIKYLMDPNCNIQRIKSKLLVKSEEILNYIQHTSVKSINVYTGFLGDKNMETFTALQSRILFNTYTLEGLTFGFPYAKVEFVDSIISQIPLITNLTYLNLTFSHFAADEIIRALTPFVVSPSCKLTTLKADTNIVIDGNVHTISDEEILLYLENLLVKNNTLITTTQGVIVLNDAMMDKIISVDGSGMINQISPKLECAEIGARNVIVEANGFQKLAEDYNKLNDKPNYIMKHPLSYTNFMIYKKNL